MIALGLSLAWTGEVGRSSILYLVAPFPCMVFGLFIWCGSHFPGFSTNFMSCPRCWLDVLRYLTELSRLYEVKWVEGSEKMSRLLH